MVNGKQHPIILGAPEREKNPLRKLIAGFCDPFIPKDDEDQTMESHEDSPRNDAKESGEATDRNFRMTVKPQQGRSVRFENLDISTLLQGPTQKATYNLSEITVESCDSTAAHDQINMPELEIARNVVRQRRQHALQVFFTCIAFVIGAIVTLQKLGYSIADFHAPTHGLLSSSSARPWIHIFDKTAVETGKIKLKAKAMVDIENGEKITTANAFKDDSISDEERHAQGNDCEDETLHSTSVDVSSAKADNSAHPKDVNIGQTTETQEL